MMVFEKKFFLTISLLLLLLAGCPSNQPGPPVDRDSVISGSAVYRGDKKIDLLGIPISLGQPLPSVPLVDAQTMADVDLSQERGKILLLNIVPSIDTKVCEAQTHYLGEKGDKLAPMVERITISRDTPFAQKRFAEDAKLTDVRYLSDYKQGEFGKATGLLMDGLALLARSVILVDKQGRVQYIQVVPDISHLPDMDTAFEKALEMAAED
jgi:thiol peroxidase